AAADDEAPPRDPLRPPRARGRGARQGVGERRAARGVGQGAGGERRAAAVRGPVGGGDARRPLGRGRGRRQPDPDPRGDRPGGARGVGNRIGRHFIEKAREAIERRSVSVPDRDLAWLDEGTPLFDDYVAAVSWAQDFATENRRLMMLAVVEAARRTPGLPPFD